MRRQHELTDEQWEKIEPLLPGRVGDPGRSAAADNRLFVNAVLFVAKTGISGEKSTTRSNQTAPTSPSR